MADVSLAVLNRFHLMDTINAAQAEGDGGTQTQIHRINAISWLYREWTRKHAITPQQLSNPAIDACPPPPGGRTRRCKDAIAARGEGEIDEESIVLAAAKRSTRKWLYSAIIIAIETAIRQAELVGLLWPDVTLDGPNPHINLAATITKTKKPRTVPLTDRAVEAFRELKAQDEQARIEKRFRMPDRPLPIETTRGILQAWTDLIDDCRRRAKENGDPTEVAEKILDDMYWHDFRHEGISRLFERTDLSDLEIMEIAGHASYQTLKRYTHLRGANIDLKARSRLSPIDEDALGTVKLTAAGPLIRTVHGRWLTLDKVDQLTQAHAKSVILQAAAALGEQGTADE